MENTTLQFEDVLAVDQGVQDQVGELNELHLAMVGGGCAEVCPY